MKKSGKKQKLQQSQQQKQPLPKAKESTEWFTQKHLDELSQDPKNVVYQYSTDHSVASTIKTFNADEAKTTVRNIRKRYLELRVEHKDWSDDKIRERICIENRTWKEFAKSYKSLFVCTTDQNTDESRMTHIFYILYMYKLKEIGTLSEKECNARVQAYMIKEFSTGRKAEPGDYVKLQPMPKP